MRAVRIVGAGCLVLAALLVWFLMAPEDAPSHSSAISAALSDAEANNALAEGAPQQTVVNGWAARDLLAVIARQDEVLVKQGATRDDRPAALLGIAVLGIALTLATGGSVMAGAAPIAARRPSAVTDEERARAGDR